MRVSRRVVIGAALAVLAALLVPGAYYGLRAAATGTAYKAKVLCSGVFVAGRDPQAVLEADLAGEGLESLRFMQARVEREPRQVTASLFGLVPRRAVYTEGRGCTLVQDGRVPAAVVAASGHKSAPPLPVAIDARLDAALDWAFSDPEPALHRRTRAI